MCLPPPSSQKANLESGEGRGLQGFHTLKPIYVLTFPPPPLPWGQPVPEAAQLCSSGAASARAQLPQPSGAMAPYGLDISPLPVAVPLGHLLQCSMLAGPTSQQ